MATLPVPTLDLYPEKVRLYTTLVKEDTYGGFCRMSFGCAEVHYSHRHTFFHEMGHATAYILGFEAQLGGLVMRQPGADSVTNENPFCYGAQRLRAHEYNRALAEYAADAINYFVTEPELLPEPVRQFIAEHWN